MYATNYFEARILNTLRGTTATAPTALYVGLFLSNPGEAGGGTEASYSGYARRAITFTSPAALGGGIGVQNTATITFPRTATALGTVTHIGVMDSLTAGNMLLFGDFTDPIAVGANEEPVIVAGEAQWWATGEMSVAYRTKAFNLLRGTNIAGFTPYAALYSGDPEAGGAELSGGGYARVALTFAAVAIQAGGQSQIQTSTAVQTARSTVAWGSWTHTAIMDAATSGQPVYCAARGSAKDIRRGMQVTFAAGDVKLSVH